MSPVSSTSMRARSTPLAKGASYIYRIAAEEIQSAQTHGFTATSDYSQITDMDAVIICVPTPLNEYHEPDLSFITDTTPFPLLRICAPGS